MSARVLDALQKLNPTEQKAVDRLVLHLMNGQSFQADYVKMEVGVIYASSKNRWLMIGREELTAIEVELDAAACTTLKIEPTLPALLEYVSKRR